MKVEPLTTAHLERFLSQPAQAAWKDKADLINGAAALAAGDSWIGRIGERIIGCAGVIDHGEGRGLAWAMLGEESGPAMLSITRAVQRYMAVAPFRRIEAKVVATFEPGRRWAKMLGFHFEGVASAYCEDGADAETWALVRR